MTQVTPHFRFEKINDPDNPGKHWYRVIEIETNFCWAMLRNPSDTMIMFDRLEAHRQHYEKFDKERTTMDEAKVLLLLLDARTLLSDYATGHTNMATNGQTRATIRELDAFIAKYKPPEKT